MTKFSLIPNPTFSVTASIPRAGAEDGKLTFTFRHKTLEELRSMDEKLQKSAEGKKAAIEPQADYLMEIVEGGRCRTSLTARTLLSFCGTIHARSTASVWHTPKS